MWEGLSLPHDTKFGNFRDEIADRRVIFIWSLIHGSSWSGLIKVGPGDIVHTEIYFHCRRFYVLLYVFRCHCFCMALFLMGSSLRWRQNGRDSVSNHQPHDCLLNRYSDVNQRKHQSSASLAFVRGIHRGPVNSPHKWPVTRKMFPFDDVIMIPGCFVEYVCVCVDDCMSVIIYQVIVNEYITTDLICRSTI